MKMTTVAIIRPSRQVRHPSLLPLAIEPCAAIIQGSMLERIAQQGNLMLIDRTATNPSLGHNSTSSHLSFLQFCCSRYDRIGRPARLLPTNFQFIPQLRRPKTPAATHCFYTTSGASLYFL